MKKDGALFELIKSLSKSEKRFIKIYASRYSVGGKNNYIRLFDAVEKLNDYDEAKVRKKMSASSFSGNFRGIKNYLYFLILDCLDFYYNDSSIDRRASKFMNIAKVLSDKRLDGQSDKIIERARKLSEEFNRFENTIALNSLEKVTGFKRETITTDKIQSYYIENLSAIESMKVKIEYNTIYDKLLHQRLHLGPIRSQLEKQKLKELQDNPYFSTPPKNNSFDANMYYLLSHIEYHRILLDPKSGGVYIRKLIALFDNNISRIADNVNHYIYALNVFISERVYGNSRSEANSILKKLISIPDLISEKSISHDVRVQIFQMYYNLVCHIALIFRDYENAIPLIRKFELERKEFEKYLIPSLRLCLQSNIACIYFGARKYKEALKWCNEAMTHPLKTRYDVIYEVRILSLLIHYELGNQIILPNLMRTTHNSLQKMNRGNQFATILLKHLHLLLGAESKQDQKLIFKQFKEEVLPLLDNKLENVVFDDIDIISWIDMKIKTPS